MNFKLILRLICLLTLVIGVTEAAEPASSAYPTRPIRLIVPFPPGGGNDTMARAIGKKLTESWGQQVIIDNRPGANSMVGTEIAARSAPDGYTLLMANIASHGINPALYKKISYDPIKDFAPVVLVGTIPNVLVVHSSMPVNNLDQFIALAKSKPGQLTYGTSGTGSSGHLASALFSTAFGINLVHVPYKGNGPAMIDLIAGRISLSFANVSPVLPHIKSKRLKPIAVTSLRRSTLLPDIQAIAEIVPGFEAGSWWGIAAPRGTPGGIVNALNQEVAKALSAPDMKERLSREGVDSRSTTPEQFAQFIEAELVKWAKAVKDSGAQAD